MWRREPAVHNIVELNVEMINTGHLKGGNKYSSLLKRCQSSNLFVILLTCDRITVVYDSTRQTCEVYTFILKPPMKCRRWPFEHEEIIIAVAT